MRRVPFDLLPPETDEILLTGEEAIHLRDVLRARVGDGVILFNGKGDEYEALILRTEKEGILLKVKGKKEGISPSPLFLTASIALLKENKVDDLIRPLVELGVQSIRIYRADRSVPVLDAAKAEKKLARWSKLAVEAMKQCGVNEAPEISFHKNLAALLEKNRENDSFEKTRNIVFWENTKTSDWPEQKEGMDHVQAIFGPEGGFSKDEVKALLDANFLPLGLGPRILRAPTAILAGTALLQYRYGDLSLAPTGFESESPHYRAGDSGD